MIFTVIIALEFERSLLVLAERQKGIVQVRTVILIALLAVVRKLIILDPVERADVFACACGDRRWRLVPAIGSSAVLRCDELY